MCDYRKREKGDREGDEGGEREKREREKGERGRERGDFVSAIYTYTQLFTPKDFKQSIGCVCMEIEAQTDLVRNTVRTTWKR